MIGPTLVAALEEGVESSIAEQPVEIGYIPMRLISQLSSLQ